MPDDTGVVFQWTVNLSAPGRLIHMALDLDFTVRRWVGFWADRAFGPFDVANDQRRTIHVKLFEGFAGRQTACFIDRLLNTSLCLQQATTDTDRNLPCQFMSVLFNPLCYLFKLPQ